MGGDPEVNDPPRADFDDGGCIYLAEEEVKHGEKVTGPNLMSVIADES